MTSRVVGESESYGSAGQEDEREGGFGAVEAVGAAGEKPDLGVEPFMAAVRESAVDGGVDAGAVFGDGSPCLTNSGMRLRWARAHQRLSSAATVAASRSPAKISRNASLSW